MPDQEVRQLPVIKKPAAGTASVMVLDHAGPMVIGEGPLTFVCGGCRNPLLVRVEPGSVQGIVIKCGKCQAHNAATI
jgi:LSD1 subclass zinc finger protein